MDFLEDLPLAQRLALSYGPRKARADTLTLLALDNRLAGILRGRNEPIIAQMKLAWWRDRLREAPSAWPSGEPLLARLADWAGDIGALGKLVDAWEILLGESLDADALDEYANGRAEGWVALAEGLGVAAGPDIRAAGRQWALSDLALNLAEGEERARTHALALAGGGVPKLPRPLRPLNVLAALGIRALVRGSTELLDGPGAAIAALRCGLTGR